MHKYICEVCKKQRECIISEYRVGCMKLCMICAKNKKYDDDYERLCNLIMKKGA